LGSGRGRKGKKKETYQKDRQSSDDMKAISQENFRAQKKKGEVKEKPPQYASAPSAWRAGLLGGKGGGATTLKETAKK